VNRPALLDVNLLVALFDPDHVHHELAHDWFADYRDAGWATCALTENGFVRVLANPRYGGTLNRPAELVKRLAQFCASGHHVFWADTVSLRDRSLFNPPLIRGHRQVTDLYLLGLARKMGGRLATFDRSITVGAVVGATRDTLAIVSALDPD
jgi:toxin-antitoxin system PIN domain toxin